MDIYGKCVSRGDVISKLLSWQLLYKDKINRQGAANFNCRKCPFTSSSSLVGIISVGDSPTSLKFRFPYRHNFYKLTSQCESTLLLLARQKMLELKVPYLQRQTVYKNCVQIQKGYLYTGKFRGGVTFESDTQGSGRGGTRRSENCRRSIHWPWLAN